MTRRGGWRRFRRNRLAMVGAAVIAIEIIVALLAGVLTDDPAVIQGAARQPPSLDHWFGTDFIGRDLFARVVHGARASLAVAAVAVAVAVAVGVVVGGVSGYYGGRLDSLLMRTTDVFLAFPYVVAAAALTSVIGRRPGAVVLVIGGFAWMPVARVFRATVLTVKTLAYVEAARALGATDWRVLVHHVGPGAIQPVVVLSSTFVGAAVLAESALSFLGLGIAEPTPAWGLLVQQGRGFLSSAPHMLFFPGAAIFVTAAAFMLVGDGLRDAVSPGRAAVDLRSLP